jgi:arylsulfatase A-like enzyme
MTPILPFLALLAAPQATQPNVIVVLADDFGVDMVNAYGVGNNVPCTPNIDNLAGQGMLFRRAWVNAACSPTRGTVMSGRYGFRTGIGSPGGLLALSEQTLPEMLVGYDTAAIGKWHLGGNGNNSHPNDTGFGHFAGTSGGGIPSYYNYTKVTDGSQSNVTNYATSEVVDDAIAAMAGMQEPWFLYVNFNSIHSPWEAPPSSLCPPAGSGCGAGGGYCQSLGGNPNNSEIARAMAEAMDTEIGRLLSAVNGVDPDAYVFFWGDNGTPGQVINTPFNGAKGSMYEGGVNVPLIVKGPGVVNAECDGLVNGADMFATLAELSGSSETADDSVSMVPFFSTPATSVRDFIYAESFDNGQTFPASNHQLAIRGERFKLIRRYQGGISEEFYDMDQDPNEANDLLPILNALQQQAYDQLVAELTTLTTPGTSPGNYCTPGSSASGCQATLSASGTPSATATSGFVVTAAGVEGGKNGLFFFGSNGRQANPWGGTSSFQCVVPPVRRGGLLGASGTVGNCDGTFVQDLNALWCPSCSSPLKNPGAGAVTQIQAWYRDPQAAVPPGQRTALSDGYEFTVLP